jgi:hypothetical protein
METTPLQLDMNQEQQALDQEDVIISDADRDGHTADISRVHDSSHISLVNQPRRYPSNVQLVSSELRCIESSPEASLVLGRWKKSPVCCFG